MLYELNSAANATADGLDGNCSTRPTEPSDRDTIAKNIVASHPIRRLLGSGSSTGGTKAG